MIRRKTLILTVAIGLPAFCTLAVQTWGQTKPAGTAAVDAKTGAQPGTGKAAAEPPDKSPRPHTVQGTEQSNDDPASDAAARAALRRLLKQLLLSDDQPEPRVGGTEQDKPNSRDPFSTTPRMREQARDVAATLTPAAAAMPKLQLRGLLDNGDERSLALLDVEGLGVILVHPQDEISLPTGRADITVMIQSITSAGVTVAVEQFGKTFLLR